MAFDDFYRVAAHAVIFNQEEKVLLVKATYANFHWGMPGGSVDPGETVQETLVRECEEELGIHLKVLYLSGIYYHHKYNSHQIIFRCQLPEKYTIKLSSEHSAYGFFALDELTPGMMQRVSDCLNFNGEVKGGKF